MRKLTLLALAALSLSACSDIYYKGITYTIDTDFYYPGRLYHPRELRSIRVSWRILNAPSTTPVCNTYRLGSPVGGVDLARRVDVTEPDAFAALATSVDFEVVGCATSDCSCGSLDGEIPINPPGAVVRQRSIARLSPQGGLRRIFLSRDCFNVVCAPESGVERTCVTGGRCVPIDQVGLEVTGAGDAGLLPQSDGGMRAATPPTAPLEVRANAEGLTPLDTRGSGLAVAPSLGGTSLDSAPHEFTPDRLGGAPVGTGLLRTGDASTTFVNRPEDAGRWEDASTNQIRILP